MSSGHATDTGVKNVPASESAERVSAAYDKVGTFSEKKKKKTDRAVARNTAVRLFIQKNNLDLDLEPDEVLGPAEPLFHYTSFSMCI